MKQKRKIVFSPIFSAPTLFQTQSKTCNWFKLFSLAPKLSRQKEAEKLMNDMRSVYDISRQQSARSKAIAKAKGRQAQRQAERR